MQRPVLAMPVAPTAPLAPAAPLAAAPASSTAVRADPGRRISLATQLQVRRLTCLTCLTWQEQHVVSGTAIVATPSSSLVERTTDHTIRFETWVGYNSTWKYFQVRGASIYVQIFSAVLTRTRASSSQMWADEQRLSFLTESAKIEGRAISYPLLLDGDSELRLEDTNTFLEWYCAHCDIVTASRRARQAAWSRH